MRINEIFVSYQGEGPFTGRKSLFIRLQGCNLNCSFCDSLESTFNGDIFGGENSTEAIYNMIKRFHDEGGRNVVFTGGEPLLQKEEIYEVLERVLEDQTLLLTIEVETNGTIDPISEEGNFLKYEINWNVSPKLPSSNQYGITKKANYGVFIDLAANFKFVVDVNNFGTSYKEILDFLEGIEYNKNCSNVCDNIWLMPLGTDKEEIIKNTTKLMSLDLPFNISSRSHIIFGVK